MYSFAVCQNDCYYAFRHLIVFTAQHTYFTVNNTISLNIKTKYIDKFYCIFASLIFFHPICLPNVKRKDYVLTMINMIMT